MALAGLRQFDRFLIANANGTLRIQSLERLIHDGTGVLATWTYDPAYQRVSLTRIKEDLDAQNNLPLQAGVDKTMTLDKVLEAWYGLGGDNPGRRYALLVDAGLLLETRRCPVTVTFAWCGRWKDTHGASMTASHSLSSGRAQHGVARCASGRAAGQDGAYSSRFPGCTPCLRAPAKC